MNVIMKLSTLIILMLVVNCGGTAATECNCGGIDVEHQNPKATVGNPPLDAGQDPSSDTGAIIQPTRDAGPATAEAGTPDAEAGMSVDTGGVIQPTRDAGAVVEYDAGGCVPKTYREACFEDSCEPRFDGCNALVYCNVAPTCAQLNWQCAPYEWTCGGPDVPPIHCASVAMPCNPDAG